MVKDTPLGRVESKFNEDLIKYANLVGLSKIGLIEELFNKEIEGKLLTNDFINIDSIYYFDFNKLVKEKEVKATKETPKTNLNNIFIVKKVPNNLDSFEDSERTYCYNKTPEKHLGIYSYNRIVLNELKINETRLFQYFIIFEYNSKTEELTLKLASVEDITLLVDVKDVKKIISNLADINKEYLQFMEDVKKAPNNLSLASNHTTEYFNTWLYLTSTLVIESLSSVKGFSWALLKNNPEAYESFKGKYNSEDLVIIRELNIVEEPEEVLLIKGGSKNE